MPSSVAPPPAPASRAWVFATALGIVGVLGGLLPAIHPDLDTRTSLFMGWVPSLLASRLWWAARVGAIRQRVITERTPVTIGNQQRWAIAVFNPRVLTAVQEPTRFRLYLWLEGCITGIVWLMCVGQAFVPLLRTVSVMLWGDGAA